jgi:hypothetical protein
MFAVPFGSLKRRVAVGETGVGEAGNGIYRIILANKILPTGRQLPAAIVSTEYPSRSATLPSVSSGRTS